jgi:replicative DNA helicase
MVLDLDEYEKIIAYKAITDSAYLNAIADYVKPEYFVNQNIATYFKIVNDFYDKRKILPTFAEVKTYLDTDALRNNFKTMLQSFKEIEGDFNVEELYENTETFLKERATWVTLVDIYENAEKKTKNPQEVLDAFDEICKINLICDAGIELYKDINLIIDNILNVESHISTKWPWLDEALDGGWSETGKALYMFAGQANIGKSIFLGNVAANIAEQGKSVLVISLEMSEMVYAKRIASNITKVPMKEFRLNTPILKRKILEEHERNPKGKIFIKEFPPSLITPKQIESFIKKLIDSGERIDAVVIDYVSLLTTTFGSNSYERIKHICEQVRAMSYIFNCPFISAVQLTRCLDTNTLVERVDGPIRIGDIRVGDSIKGTTGWVEVKHVYPSERKKVFRVKTKSGKIIICSDNHVFPTVKGNMSISSGLSVGCSLFSAVQ